MVIRACVIYLSAAMVLAGSSVPDAKAQSASAKALFEKYNLLGTFASDCSKPVGKTNYYYVHRVVDASHVQRDQMSGETTRDFFVLFESGRELRPNEIALHGTRDGQPLDVVFRAEASRIRTLEAKGGKQTVTDGRFPSGLETPWLTKCRGSG